ncbi:hypothetical protein SAICODRAFT_59270 [Saitoella complicata NRRL Y-17804]|nr:uncharacterized protein SAICODRAFT_59270 [Saitoella complicata NRRL Y-17804]ODQ51691.1 hypothetical protein SAICODRAFT_59270 [Saitoella complicata NRRL Y-17804]
MADPDVVRRHLVNNGESSALSTSLKHAAKGQLGGGGIDDEFSSLQLQGGDITRQVYRWQESAAAEAAQAALKKGRSLSYSEPRMDETGDETLRALHMPGGFRRNFIAQRHAQNAEDEDGPSQPRPQLHRPALTKQPTFLTRNFIEFLTLYGHFAGEELEEEEEEDEYGEDVAEEGRAVAPEGLDDRQPLLASPRKARAHARAQQQGNATVTKAVLLLLKSFVGTGVLFLPKAFLNGGMLFSSLFLLGISAVSLYCFLLLVNARLVIPGSFGDIGGALFGPKMRSAILFSIAISQIGFVCAYTIFTAENLSAFVSAVTDCRVKIDIIWMFLLQLIIFMPLAMIRDINKLSGTALVADFFILLGLLGLYYYDILTLSTNGLADIELFNANDFTLFIGTAVFTFEGIGLIIPVQEAMARPEKLPKVLSGVMLLITVVFTSIGVLSYAAYGSSVKTVVLLNLPQDSKFVNSMQFLYSLAILLSTPLQLFPAIRIMEQSLFTKSGKYSSLIKWEKNLFRFALVMFSTLIAWLGAADLDKFVSLIGSLACVPLVYIYPPMLHYRACANTRWAKLADIAMGIAGVGVMVYTTSTTIQSWADKSAPAPGYCDSR